MAMLATFALLAALGGAAPVAGSPAPAQVPSLASTPGQTLSFTVGNSVRSASVTPSGLLSDGVELRRTEGRLRGRVGSEQVDMRLEPGRLDGELGLHPISLDVWRAGGELRVAGTFGERTVAMGVSRKNLHAQVGPCWYDLALTGGASYSGFVTCGGPSERVQLTLPSALVARDDRELAGMLTALLAR